MHLDALSEEPSHAGKLLRESWSDDGSKAASDTQARIVWRAVAATKLPTLTAPDLSLFKALMRDTWPGLHVERAGSDALDSALRQVLEAWQLAAVPEQVGPFGSAQHWQ